jgi:subtilase family serine protease
MKTNLQQLFPGALLFASCAWSWLLFTTTARAADGQVLHGHVPNVVTTLNLQPVGRLSATNRLHLAIGLPLRNPQALSNLLQQIYDPASPQYHQYLTPAQFTEMFGPVDKDYQSLIGFVRTNGFTITGLHSNRMLVDVDSAVGDIEKALHVTMRVYQHPTQARTFYAPDREPSIDFAGPVLHISGLDNYILPHPLLHPMPATGTTNATGNAGSGPFGTFMGHDFRAAYAPGVALTGAGQAVGLFELDGYYTTDITAYEASNGLASVTLTNVLLDGFTGAPGGASDEVSLDIEMAISMAPGLSRVIVYEGYLPDDVLNSMAAGNQAKQLSCSWGWSGDQNSTLDQIFQEFAAQGQSFFTASGDSDAYGGANTMFQPADNPYITVVGGTTLTTTGPGGSWASETTWNWGVEYYPYDNGVGSSGGISTTYAIPSWQQGINMSTNLGSMVMRNIPDVAMTADNVWVIFGNGLSGDFGGTSCAAPLWAGFTALINQQAAARGQPPVGFINPVIYGIGTGPGYTSAFHDITTGNNASSTSPKQFFAVSGYDLCTGWGTPNGSNLINAVQSASKGPVLIGAGAAVSGGEGNGLINPNDCSLLTLLVKNIGQGTVTAATATLSTSTPGVTITQPASTYPDIAPGASAANVTSFQIGTSPAFVCGTPVVLSLALTSTAGSYTVTYTLLTGNVYAISQTGGASIVPGATDTGNHCDDCTTTISLPVAYSFYGQTYSNVALSSNGNLQFAGNNAVSQNACLPQYGFVQTIFPFWQDLRTDGPSNGVFTSTSGAAPNRIFNIEWRAVYYSGAVSTSSVNFEVRLYESQQRFDIIYGNLNGVGSQTTVGVQEAQDNYTQIECNAGGLGSGLQLAFQIPPCLAGGASCDSVGDGIPNWWRAQYFHNQPPNNVDGTMTNSQSCATCDADGTAQNNLFKYVAGLDPTNPASVFVLKIASVTGQPTQKNLIFNPEVGGRTYTPQFRTNLASGAWATLTGIGGPATNVNQVTVTDLSATQTSKFYRVHISLP